MTVSSSALALQDGPAKLFVDLWCRASQWDPTSRLLSPECAEFGKRVQLVLEQDDGASVFKILSTWIPRGNSERERGKVLEIMRSIDRSFLLIHPRSVVLPAGIGARTKIPKWLLELRERRNGCADYGSFDGNRLIARGPLSRGARREEESYADNLADRFAALEVVPQSLALQGRVIGISHKVISQSSGSGLAPRCSPGEVIVTVVPVAEQKDDLVLAEREVCGRKLIDYQINPTLNPAEQLIKALEVAGASDIAISPEFVMPEDQAEKVSKLLSQEPSKCRLIVAGSGLTRDQRDGLPWNETQVLNGFGAELWRQRKLWPAGIGRDQAVGYGISEQGFGLSYEATAAGDELVVADIDGLGRCVVLICQDLEGRPLADEFVRVFQPDWIFVPILDPGIKEGNWVHQRVFGLSAAAHTRYIIACSTSLFHRIGKMGEPACALAIGPRKSTEEDQGRRFHLSPVATGTAPGYVSIQWSTAKWNKTKLGRA